MSRARGAGRTRALAVGVVREIAPDVFCLGPWGRTQTAVYFVRSGASWVLIDAGRVLIAGDALVTLEINSWTGLLPHRPGLSGPPWYTTWNRQTARQSIQRLARLSPAVLAGGHGEPMTGAGTAAAVAAFAALTGVAGTARP